ncbi:MAG: C40 family peptidase, partial [Pseudobutyrivibrio sp.]|nr:C40 family peptidase [Pseudobutyrivibrio sp.]
MNEKLYTRDSPKKPTVESEIKKKHGPHGDKLMNENSAADSYRKKLRHDKKDNSLGHEELKKAAKTKRQGRKAIYADAALASRARESIIQNEDENVGTDSLNAGLFAAEIAEGKASNYGRKLHAKNEHLEAVQGARGAKAASEAGEGGEAVKAARKKLIQKEYAEAAYKKHAAEAANNAGGFTKRFTDKAEDLVGRLAEAVKEFFEEHPGVLIGAAIILLVALVVSASLTSCSSMMSGGGNMILDTSFTAQDWDILQVEADYVELEKNLQKKIERIERDYPGYDEYQYSLAEISHNPFELAALLTVLYEDYTPSEVQSKLATIFEYQYKITITEVVEIRTRTVEKTGYRWVSDGTVGGISTGHLESYTYEEEEEYEYYILKTTLTNSGIQRAVNSLGLTEEQLSRYAVILELRGNKPDIFGDNPYANPGVSEEYQDYDIPGEYLTNQQFANMIQEAEKYLGYPYVWGGSSPSTSFDCSGFVSFVINNSGNDWNYGRLTANGWKNATARVSGSDVKPGDLVFFQGTYNTSGASHVGIVVDPVNKIMIHCGNP